MPAPIPAPIPGRPLYVFYEGGRLYVSAHDRYYLEMLRVFKRKLRAAHPDVNHQRWATGHTRQLLHERERWQPAESAWYSQFGLDPPKGTARRLATTTSGSVNKEALCPGATWLCNPG